MNREETEEEKRNRLRKEEHRRQHIAIAFFIIVPIIVGVISAATGSSWLIGVMIFGGIGLALWSYDKQAFVLILGMIVVLLLIAIAL